MRASSDPVRDCAAGFLDRTHVRLGEQLNPACHADRDESLDFVRAHFDLPDAPDPMDKALRLDTNVMLVDDPVKRVDTMTMGWGLEARVLFLDHELVEMVGRIPAEHKLAQGGKRVLKNAARKVIPHAVIDRQKGYFPVPALEYIACPYLDMVKDAQTNTAARDRGLFR